jgi:nitroreductase
METWDAIRARRNVREYEARPLERAQLERILEAGRRAPSSSNEQHWDFVVVTDRAQLQELSKVWRAAWHTANSAATIALVAPLSDRAYERDSIQYDLGQATMSMMLAAADLGIGSGHAAVTDQGLARSILHLPADRFCAWLVALGWPADGPLRPIRRPARRHFEEVVHWDQW